MYVPAHGLSIDKTNALAATMRFLATSGQNDAATLGDGHLTGAMAHSTLLAADAVVTSNCTGTDRTVVDATVGGWEPDLPEVAAIGTVKRCEAVASPPPTTTTATTTTTTTTVASTSTSTSTAPASVAAVVTATPTTRRGHDGSDYRHHGGRTGHDRRDRATARRDVHLASAGDGHDESARGSAAVARAERRSRRVQVTRHLRDGFGPLPRRAQGRRCDRGVAMSVGLPPPRIDDLVVDLRVPDETPVTRHDPHRRRAMALVIGVFVLIVAVCLAYETLATGFMHDQRQRHLAADFAERKPLAVSHAAAILQIPSIGVDEMVVESDRVEHLRDGPIHDPHTPLPGVTGNAVIIGRRTRFGGPFAHLDRVKVGDQIVVRAKNVPITAFTVVCTQQVAGGESSFAAPSNGRRLTLVTVAGGLIPSRRSWWSPAQTPPTTSVRRSAPRATRDRVARSSRGRGSPIANLGMLTAYAAVVTLVAIWRWTRRRYRSATRFS